MFTKNVNDEPVSTRRRRGPGRPRGRTPQGTARRRRLYEIAIRGIAERGYEGMTLRDIARAARVSPALLYRYFPSKRSIVLALYDELSAAYADRATDMPRGRWRDRYLFALKASLAVLSPHRGTLSALVAVLVGDREEGLFAPGTAFSRQRVEAVFREAVAGAEDRPARDVVEPLGRVLYLVHLAVLLWWLLDKSPHQRATAGLVALIARALPLVPLALRVGAVRRMVRDGDALFRDALYDDVAAG